MFITRLAIFVLLIVSISQAKESQPFDFFKGTYNDFTDCLRTNNITIAEYEKFDDTSNLDNVLKENVELKYKCNIKCQLEREPTKWLNARGEVDLKAMKATSKAAASISKCMEKAPNESCAYVYKLVICAFKAGHPSSVIKFESYEHITEETAGLAANQQDYLDDYDTLDV
ncbi:general odorant-binding protein 57a [Drosophila erecta]|uniref:Odorant-binding protein 57a n=1 Tax=Drosophila erecta TaxID=7220 RepID=B3NJK1_DROER|nr:general odorant-binding protein 57a [Drosophila erecta]EDV55308.1 Odorant-binding protein 57a [Drosophila erecta]